MSLLLTYFAVLSIRLTIPAVIIQSFKYETLRYKTSVKTLILRGTGIVFFLSFREYLMLRLFGSLGCFFDRQLYTIDVDKPAIVFSFLEGFLRSGGSLIIDECVIFVRRPPNSD